MYQELIEIYKNAFPDDNGRDAGYIFRDGTVIDISKPFIPYCHGREFLTEPSLAEWRNARLNELPNFPRPAIDVIMNELGVIEFTIDNCHLQCVRLPQSSITADQRSALVSIISNCLDRGFIRLSILETNESLILACAESPYLQEEISINDSLTSDYILSIIDNYYITGHLTPLL